MIESCPCAVDTEDCSVCHHRNCHLCGILVLVEKQCAVLPCKNHARQETSRSISALQRLERFHLCRIIALCSDHMLPEQRLLLGYGREFLGELPESGEDDTSFVIY